MDFLVRPKLVLGVVYNSVYLHNLIFVKILIK